MNFNCSDDLKRLHAQFIRDIQEGKLAYHYVTSACEYNLSMKCACCGGWEFVHYHKVLQDAANQKLGCKIGDDHGNNAGGKPLTVGVCAEQHAANDVLKDISPYENIPIDITDFVFSPAIRLKGKQMKTSNLAPCINCETLFSKPNLQ